MIIKELRKRLPRFKFDTASQSEAYREIRKEKLFKYDAPEILLCHHVIQMRKEYAQKFAVAYFLMFCLFGRIAMDFYRDGDVWASVIIWIYLACMIPVSYMGANLLWRDFLASITRAFGRGLDSGITYSHVAYKMNFEDFMTQQKAREN